ncbi:LysR family transcriptional regulator [Caenimonas sedimenti]|uniref:LysR family transcriptional regulator n=1 Tax=Caenimonas sedimenti TaxID=2596921 RepID=A0A562ZRT5_9BURK|nr:LysR family transcriptional regulator [Caenimonas sedimenti]TWO71117.1 LysR family transcriptional regulator [Caenimonas sedimenti]
MDYRQIQYFVCLYEEGSVTRAASRLNIVQPALSMQIARLEEALGRQLFVRSNRGMVPTAHGTQMYALFMPVLADFERARAQLLSSGGELAGHARIGLPASIAQDVLAEALVEFSARFPRVTVSVTEAYSEALIQGVASGQLDTAIVNRPRRLALLAEPVLDEEFVLAVGLAHPPLPVRMPLRDALKLRLVLPTRQHGLRAALEGFADAAGLQIACAVEVDSLGAIAQIVERGEHATLLPRTALRGWLAAGSLREHHVTRPVLRRHLVSLAHPRRPVPAQAAGLLEVVVRRLREKT